MQEVKSPHPPGVIIVTSGDLARYVDFAVSLNQMRVPCGSTLAWTCGADISLNRNMGIEKLLADPKYRWGWLIDDDHSWDADLLLRLLDRRVDVVAPLCTTRYPPFRPVSAKRGPDGGWNGNYFRTWQEVQTSGLQESMVIGGAGPLIRREVFEKIPAPWYHPGALVPGRLGEDTYFSLQLFNANVSMWIDSDNKVGHMTPSCLWPVPGYGLQVGFDLSRARLTVPIGMEDKP